MIDVLVVGLVLLVGYGASAAVWFMIDPRDFDLPTPAGWLNLAAGLMVLHLYLTGAWALSGRTYGNLVIGLRVVTRRGHRVRLVHAFVRASAYLLLPIGLWWCALSAESRSLQDILCRTSVIYDWPGGRDGPTPEGDSGRTSGCSRS